MSKAPKPPVIIKLYPGSKKARDDLHEFGRLVGASITTWAFLDREIFRLFSTHLGATNRRAAIVYYRIPMLSGRLDLTDALMKHELSKNVFELKWRPIHNSIRSLLGIRSVIAHQPPLRTSTGRGGAAIYLHSIHIEPAELEVKTFEKLRGKTELNMKDLRDHADQVTELIDKLRIFTTVLLRRKRKRGA